MCRLIRNGTLLAEHIIINRVLTFAELHHIMNYRVAQKISHYQESSLNCIKNRQCSYISHQF